MRRDKQLDLMRRLMKHLDEGSTATTDKVFINEMSSYQDAERHARERQTFFRDRPVFMAMSPRIASPGDYYADSIDGVPLVLVRGKDGIARCFVNVCRHRGARLVEGEGCGMKMFSCPYHAWTYTLEGALKGIPDARSFEGVDKETHGLREIPVTEEHGLIWVGPINPDAPAVDSPIAPMADEIGDWDFQNYHYFDSIRITRPMNWKFVLDTFMETYHISTLHRATIDPIIHSNLTTFDAFGDHHRMVIARKTLSELQGVDMNDVDVFPYIGFVYGLFANATLIIQGSLQAEVWRVSPSGDNPGEAEIELSMCVPEKPTSEKAEKFWRKNFNLAMKTVESEDFPLGALIQQNVASGMQDRVYYGRNEPTLAHFHGRIRKHLGLPELT
ncbi:aromatic ring-hydroxylating oxygenase subunit alpha [Minwuia sp.]|uniref:aromatic ring-hydroxylating oxygenase subunit alpha n=1 Tax=Minwuia sp. TaxID=2493630 RepID=UPI003A9285A8